jgi:transglutaminase-like putative cysteine protease
MLRSHVSLAVLLCFVASSCSSKGAGAKAEPATVDAASSSVKARRVSLVYETKMPEVPAGTAELKVWIPKARQEGSVQRVVAQDVKGPPGSTVIDGRDATGETSFWCVVVPKPTGSTTVTATYDVVRTEQKNNDFRGAGVAALTGADRERLASALAPNVRVPNEGLPSELAASVAPGEKNSLNVARALYDTVLSRMRYDKSGTGWGQGDTLWACGSGYGNCTDFHSMFMSFARSRGIPARFFMGMSIPEARGKGSVGGYHCWAEFFVPELGWVPVDISEADKHPELAQYYFGSLTEDRVSFTLGRDLRLNPAPASGVQNFFIYPIAEADGKTVKVERTVTYEDRSL